MWFVYKLSEGEEEKVKELNHDGTHTYSLGTTITYEQFRKIWTACYRTGCIVDDSNVFKGIEKLYCYAYMSQGIKVYLHGKPGKLYRLRIQIEPCRVLGSSDATAVASLNKKQYKELVKTADKMLRKLEISQSIDAMKISRCDLTINIYFSTEEELMEYLRIFKKSLLIPHYSRVFFKKNDQKTNDWKTANNHSHCISCKSASFLIYDKIAQLEMIDRCDDTLLDKHILRLEAELKRPALKKHLGKTAMETNYKILSSAAKNARNVIRWYIDRLQPRGNTIRYEDAVDLISSTKMKAKTRERMLYLLRKASDSDDLSSALKKMQNATLS